VALSNPLSTSYSGRYPNIFSVLLISALNCIIISNIELGVNPAKYAAPPLAARYSTSHIVSGENTKLISPGSLFIKHDRLLPNPFSPLEHTPNLLVINQQHQLNYQEELK
jgi:hypothetical protein